MRAPVKFRAHLCSPDCEKQGKRPPKLTPKQTARRTANPQRLRQRTLFQLSNLGPARIEKARARCGSVGSVRFGLRLSIAVCLSSVRQVMPETMAAARTFSRHVREISEDISQAAGGAIAAEVHKRTAKAGEPESAGVDAVKKGAAVGAQVGSVFGSAVETIAPVVARSVRSGGVPCPTRVLPVDVDLGDAGCRHAGAHQCDSCEEKNLYNYYRCTDSKCDYDLCVDCHGAFVGRPTAKVRRRACLSMPCPVHSARTAVLTRGLSCREQPKSKPKHPAHTFTYHDNVGQQPLPVASVACLTQQLHSSCSRCSR